MDVDTPSHLPSEAQKDGVENAPQSQRESQEVSEVLTDDNPLMDFKPLISESDFGCTYFDSKSFHYWQDASEQNSFLTDRLRCTRVGKIVNRRHRQHRRKVPTALGAHQENKLRKAASAGNINDVNLIISSSPDLNLDAADEKKRTALHFSAAKGADDIVQLLLRNGANPCVKDMNGNTPLHLAACTSHIRVVTLLLHYGADATALDKTGKTPFHLALSHLEMFRVHEEESRRPVTKRKIEVREIASLLQEYLIQKGREDEKEHVKAVLEKLANTETDSEVRPGSSFVFCVTL